MTSFGRGEMTMADAKVIGSGGAKSRLDGQPMRIGQRFSGEACSLERSTLVLDGSQESRRAAACGSQLLVGMVALTIANHNRTQA
jgi:hypothetical protein